MITCAHKNFSVNADINRFEDTGGFAADITIHCVECGLPFRFIGLEAGLRPDMPMVSVDGLELRAPIEPETEKRFASHSTFKP